MNILNRLTIRHLKKNKKRSIVTILAVTLSTVLMVGIGLIFSTMREYLLQINIDNYGSHHVYIEVPQNEIKLIEDNSNIKTYFSLSRVGFAKVEQSANPNKPYLYIAGASDKKAFENIELKEGRYPEREDEIIVPTSLISILKLPIQVGDTITLEIGRRTYQGMDLNNNTIPYQKEEVLEDVFQKEYTVVGLLERSYLESYEAPGYMAYTFSSFSSSYLDTYITYKNVRNVYPLTDLLVASLHLKENPLGYNQVIYNRAILSLSGISNYANVTNAMTGIIILVLALLSVGCAMVIYNSFAISVTERKKQFGLFASIGATPSQRRKSVFFESFIISIIGIPLGILISILFGYVFIQCIHFFARDLFIQPLTLSFYPLFIFIPILFMIITIILSVYLPAFQASVASPIEAVLLQKDIKSTKKKFLLSPIIQKLFGVEGVIAYKNQKRNKKRYRVTIFSLVISIVLFISFSGMIQYFVQFLAQLNVPDYDLYLSVKNTDNSRYSALFDEVKNREEVSRTLQVDSIVLGAFIDKENFADTFLKEESLDGHLAVSVLPKEDYEKYKKQLGILEDQPILVNHYLVEEQKEDSDLLEEVVYHPFKTNRRLTLTPTYARKNSSSSTDFEPLQITYDNVLVTDTYPELFASGSIINGGYYVLTLFVNEEEFNTLWERLQEVGASHYLDLKKDIYVNSVLYVKCFSCQKLDAYIHSIVDGNDVGYVNLYIENQLRRQMVLSIQIVIYTVIILITLIGITSIFNTIYTNISLRRKEFAMLRSVGLSPTGFNRMLYFESLFIGLKSLLIGIPLSFLFLYAFFKVAIPLTSYKRFLIPKPSIVLSIIGVFFIVLFTMYYASRKIKKENILDALREENI